MLVFLPMIAAHQLDLVTIGQALLAFAAYSLIASSVYLLNDLLDLASDRAHPRKRLRPFACGALPLVLGDGAGAGAAACGHPVWRCCWARASSAVMAFYYVVTTAYSFDLKRRLVVDICTLAGLYTLRIIAGGVATGIPLSVWLLAFSIFFFFALAAMKRQAELVSGAAAGEEKAHGRGYMTTDLPIVANMAIASGYVSVLVMALWLDSPAVRRLYDETAPLWGICLVLLYWISRMVMITHRGWMHDDPVVFAARDRVSILCGALILALRGCGDGDVTRADAGHALRRLRGPGDAGEPRRAAAGAGGGRWAGGLRRGGVLRHAGRAGAEIRARQALDLRRPLDRGRGARAEVHALHR